VVVGYAVYLSSADGTTTGHPCVLVVSASRWASRPGHKPGLGIRLSLQGNEVQKVTLNKDIRDFNAFLNGAVRNRFLAPDLQTKKVKAAQKPVTALTPLWSCISVDA